MRRAPAGAVVSFYVDLVDQVGEADIIETESGRRYAVLAVRVQQRGKHRGRQHLKCVVLASDAPYIPGQIFHRIRWYARGRRAA